MIFAKHLSSIGQRHGEKPDEHEDVHDDEGADETEENVTIDPDIHVVRIDRGIIFRHEDDRADDRMPNGQDDQNENRDDRILVQRR